MRIAEIGFAIWAVLVGLNWLISNPESAPQQAALAGQTLVLLCIPYCIIAVIQRGQKPQSTKTQD